MSTTTLLALFFSVLGGLAGNVWVMLLPWAALVVVFLAHLLNEPCDDSGVARATLGLAAFTPPVFFVLVYALGLWLPSREFALGLMAYVLITFLALGDMAAEIQRLREARELRLRLIQASPERRRTTEASPRA